MPGRSPLGERLLPGRGPDARNGVISTRSFQRVVLSTTLELLMKLCSLAISVEVILMLTMARDAAVLEYGSVRGAMVNPVASIGSSRDGLEEVSPPRGERLLPGRGPDARNGVISTRSFPEGRAQHDPRASNEALLLAISVEVILMLTMVRGRRRTRVRQRPRRHGPQLRASGSDAWKKPSPPRGETFPGRGPDARNGVISTRSPEGRAQHDPRASNEALPLGDIR